MRLDDSRLTVDNYHFPHYVYVVRFHCHDKIQKSINSYSYACIGNSMKNKRVGTVTFKLLKHTAFTRDLL